MLVRQRIVHRLHQRLVGQDLLGHLVHGVLDTGAVILGEDLQGDLAGTLPGGVELGDDGADLVQRGEGLPGPAGVDVGAEDAVPGFLEGGVLVAQEAPELRVGALEHGQLGQAGGDGDAAALGHVDLHGALLLAVAHERVRVRLAVDGQPGPAVRDDVDVRDVDVPVLGDEVGAQDGAEELRRRDGVLLGQDVDGVLDGVGGDDDAVVGFGVAV